MTRRFHQFLLCTLTLVGLFAGTAQADLARFDLRGAPQLAGLDSALLFHFYTLTNSGTSGSLYLTQELSLVLAGYSLVRRTRGATEAYDPNRHILVNGTAPISGIWEQRKTIQHQAFDFTLKCRMNGCTPTSGACSKSNLGWEIIHHIPSGPSVFASGTFPSGTGCF